MAVLFQPSRSRDEKHPWSQACGPLGSHVCGALPPPAPSAGWRGPFSGAQSFQKPARHRSLLSPLTHLPALTGALSLSFSTSQGLGNKSRDPPMPLKPAGRGWAAGRAQAAAISQPRATPCVVGHPSCSSQACETRGGSVSQTRKPVLGGPGLQRCQEASGDTGPHVYPGDPWTAGPAGPQVPHASYPGFC